MLEVRGSNYLITKISHGVTAKNWSLYVLSLNTNMSGFNLFKIKFLSPLGNMPVTYNIVWQYVGGKTGEEGERKIFKNSHHLSTNHNNCFQKK